MQEKFNSRIRKATGRNRRRRGRKLQSEGDVRRGVCRRRKPSAIGIAQRQDVLRVEGVAAAGSHGRDWSCSGTAVATGRREAARLV
ncbi:hypothetical protein RYX36_013708 [Vicia faba]